MQINKKNNKHIDKNKYFLVEAAELEVETAALFHSELWYNLLDIQDENQDISEDEDSNVTDDEDTEIT